MSTLGNVSQQVVSPSPTLYIKEIQDIFIRKNFQALVDYFSKQNQLLNFQFFELLVEAAITTPQSLSHQLGYVPKDVIISHKSGSGVLQFQYINFTANEITYTATGPCRVRFFLGTYFADKSTVPAQNTDVQNV